MLLARAWNRVFPRDLRCLEYRQSIVLALVGAANGLLALSRLRPSESPGAALEGLRRMNRQGDAVARGLEEAVAPWSDEMQLALAARDVFRSLERCALRIAAGRPHRRAAHVRGLVLAARAAVLELAWSLERLDDFWNLEELASGTARLGELVERGCELRGRWLASVLRSKDPRMLGHQNAVIESLDLVLTKCVHAQSVVRATAHRPRAPFPGVDPLPAPRLAEALEASGVELETSLRAESPG